MEQSLLLIKPDGLQRGLVGEILARFERKGLRIVGLKMINLSSEQLDEHYSHIADKPFFIEIKNYMQSSPVAAIVLEGGEGSVAAIRILVGPTKGHEAPAGTIRGDFGLSSQSNIVHASDSVENGRAEVERFFKDDELFDYEKADKKYI